MNRINEENINTVERYEELFSGWMKSKPGFDYSDKSRSDFLVKRFKGGTFMDVGCLRSPLSVETKKLFPEAEVWALDFFPGVIDYFKPKYPEVNFVLSDCKNTPFKDEYFDYLVAGELIEHIEKPEEFVKEMYRILKKGGTLALSTPFEERDNNRGGAWHLWSFTKKDIEDLLKDFEVEVSVESFGMKYIVAFAKKI